MIRSSEIRRCFFEIGFLAMTTVFVGERELRARKKINDIPKNNRENEKGIHVIEIAETIPAMMGAIKYPAD